MNYVPIVPIVDYYDPIGVNFAIYILLFALFLFLIEIASGVFLGLCVYNDAQYKGVKNPSMWGLLSGFLGWIPAVIYLAMRSQQSAKRCERCFAPLLPGAAACAACGLPVYSSAPEQSETFHKRSKTFLILWIVSISLVLVATIGLLVYVFSTMNSIIIYD